MFNDEFKRETHQAVEQALCKLSEMDKLTGYVMEPPNKMEVIFENDHVRTHMVLKCHIYTDTQKRV